MQYRAKPLLDTLVFRVGSVVGAAYFTWALRVGMTPMQRRLLLCMLTAAWAVNSYLLGAAAESERQLAARPVEAAEKKGEDAAHDGELSPINPPPDDAAARSDRVARDQATMEPRAWHRAPRATLYLLAACAWTAAWFAQPLADAARASSSSAGDVLGPPVLALAPPGATQIQDAWRAVRLVHRQAVAHDVVLLRFALPNAERPLGLSTTACILVRGVARSGLESTIRPYTPVSTNADVGTLTLLVKTYPEGRMSRHLGDLGVGGSVEAMHGAANVKKQYPFGVGHVVLLAGGSGITPMVQILHACLGNTSEGARVTLLYSNQAESDIIARSTLLAWQASSRGRLTVVHTLTREPEGSGWGGRRGRIDRALIEQHVPSPSSSLLIFVCGTPGMYDSFSGPRRGAFGGLLQEMGYAEAQVIKL